MTGLTVGTPVSRFAALGLTLFVAWLGWALLVAPLFDARDALDAEIAVTRASNARLYTQVAATRYDRERAILTEPTSALAAARLQSEVEQMVEAAGGTIERAEATVLPRLRTSRRLDAVQVATTFTATTAQLREVLTGIERARMAMIIDELSISPSPEQAANETLLSVAVTVRGFRLRGRSR
jgi:hypothetical protein